MTTEKPRTLEEIRIAAAAIRAPDGEWKRAIALIEEAFAFGAASRASPEEGRAVEALRAEKDGAYAERNQVVALLARMALALGWRAGLRSHEPDPDPTWDSDWRNVVAIDLPTGQVTWHYHDSDRPLFARLPPYAGSWDGHDTFTKYHRVNAALRSPPAPSDDPGECVRCGDGRGGVCPHGCTSAPPLEDEGAREEAVHPWPICEGCDSEGIHHPPDCDCGPKCPRSRAPASSKEGT